jgi:hypothetical protein
VGELEALERVINTGDLRDADPDDIEEAGLEGLVDEDAEAFGLWLDSNCLELSVKKDTRGDDYGARVEILRTFGGPNCYITRDTDDGDTVEVTTHWGSDSSRRRVTLRELANRIDELVYMMA